MTSETQRVAQSVEEPSGGTGLADVCKILTKVPYERQLSLNFKLGVSLAEELVRAISLINLGKSLEALDKLQALGENAIANHLSETVRTCSQTGVKPENLSIVPFQEGSNVETLVDLARIFKVLAEERLCDTSLRDSAYQTALAACMNKNCAKETSEYLHMDLRAEAMNVCGPELEITVGGTGFCSIQPLVQVNTTAGQDRTGSGRSLPSSRQDDASICSYPSHLEISVTETVGLEPSNLSVEPLSPMSLAPVPSHVPPCAVRTGNQGAFKYFSRVTSSDTSSTQNEPLPVKVDRPNGFAASCERKTGSEDMNVSALSPANLDKLMGPNDKQYPNKNIVPLLNTSQSSSHQPSLANSSTLSVSLTEHKSTSDSPLITQPLEDEEEEEEFFSFVVLHAHEDEAIAEKLKDKLEAIGVVKGATFCQEFAVPGRNTLMCVEDAINNSAFTILLLTRNFNSRLLEVETTSALMNAIQKRHKYNTVIPFLPQENYMPDEKMPLFLKIYIKLKEGKNFEKTAKQAMSLQKIGIQRQMWLSEQALRVQVRKRERLEQQKRLQMDLNRQRQLVDRLERDLMKQEHQECSMTVRENELCHPQYIHIENAHNIIIGDNCTMTVGVDGYTGEDDDDGV
ncbi:hypothetical protein DPEC_G00214710 [Dallia pectoralis]|uniref:Uncharacterized protein n=1 Tax=Dallia pectoralis TaxID=75939 RepID=A0ACC2G290_DALPE|nr:hypothetical protein DPEC_G00214710 [Dallia pectoralis]